jgi:hypothetical protein
MIYVTVFPNLSSYAGPYLSNASYITNLMFCFLMLLNLINSSILFLIESSELKFNADSEV